MQAEAHTIQLMGLYTYKTMETPGTGRYMNSTTPNQSFVTWTVQFALVRIPVQLAKRHYILNLTCSTWSNWK